MGAVSILGKRIAKWTYGGHGRRDRPSLCPTNSNGIAPLVYAAVDPEVIHRCRSTGRKIDLETYTFESSLHHLPPRRPVYLSQPVQNPQMLTGNAAVPKDPIVRVVGRAESHDC